MLQNFNLYLFITTNNVIYEFQSYFKCYILIEQFKQVSTFLNKIKYFFFGLFTAIEDLFYQIQK